MNLRSACLRPVANAFFQNVARMDSFSNLPAVIAAEAFQEQLWKDCATFKVTGALSAQRKRPYSKKIGESIQCEFVKLQNAERRRFKRGEVRMSDKIKRGADHVIGMLGHEVGAMQGMEATLFSVVIETWTAFESLCNDLWVVALDNGIADWRKRVKLKEHKLKSEDDDSQTPIEDADLSQMADPQDKYGTAFRDKGIWFQKLSVIRYWYKTTFGRPAAKLFEEHAYIGAVSAVRNVIIHKAGKADRKYVNAVDKFPALNTAAIGKPIHLDGEIVRELQNSALRLAGDLVLYVDGQITPET